MLQKLTTTRTVTISFNHIGFSHLPSTSLTILQPYWILSPSFNILLCFSSYTSSLQGPPTILVLLTFTLTVFTTIMASTCIVKTLSWCWFQLLGLPSIWPWDIELYRVNRWGDLQDCMEDQQSSDCSSLLQPQMEHA